MYYKVAFYKSTHFMELLYTFCGKTYAGNIKNKVSVSGNLILIVLR